MCQATAESGRLEIATIFRALGDAHRRAHTLSAVQRRAMRAIETCRTAALGGRLETCTTCGTARAFYNSCRNRHCPKCQTFAARQWLEARRADLLPVPYFHLVFTLPHAVNPLAIQHPALIYSLLFRCASQTLIHFGQHDLGGEIGLIAVLHTWSQTLAQHIHLHCIVPAGALADDGSRWQPARERFLFPVRALSRAFRRRFIDALRNALTDRHLAPAASLWTELWCADWVVYSKPPFGGPRHVLDYLARYTHRVAISSERLVDFDGHVVRFSFRDAARQNSRQVLALPGHEFIRRFLLHVLPRGFVRIRHFGFLSNRRKRAALATCRALLDAPPIQASPEETVDAILRLTGIDVTRCPVCGRSTIQSTPIPCLTITNPRAPPATRSGTTS